MGVPRATEWTIRDLLQEELRKRGVTVVPEVSIATPVARAYRCAQNSKAYI